MKRIIKACFLAGLVPGVLAPFLWPLVVWLMEGELPNWSSYPVAAAGIFFFATILGLGVCGTIGVSCLLCLEKFKLNSPPLFAMLGFILGCAMLYMAGPDQLQTELPRSWPMYAFFGVLGAACGFTASYRSRSKIEIEMH